MKKLLGMFAFIAVFSGIAGANCLTIEFDNRDSFCLAFDKSGKTYTASMEKNNLSSGPNVIRCEMLLPDNSLEDLGACNGSFKYSSSKEEEVKIYVRYNNTYYTVISSEFDFDDASWGSVIDDSNDYIGSRRSSDDEISITTSDKNVDTNEYVDVTIETDSDYRGKVELSAYYRSSSSSSWTSVSNTNSTYFYTNYSDEWENGYYKMTSTDKGKVKIKELVKFKKEGQYKIEVEDTDGNEDYVIFNVGDDDDDENSKVSIEVDDKSVDTKEDIKITVNTDKDYRKDIEFKGWYRSSSSSSWKSISSNNDSDYYDTRSSYWKNGYTMTSSDKGEVVFKNFLSFKKSGEYKIQVEDDYDNTDYVIIKVGDDDDDNDEISITTSDKNVDTNEYVDVTIETDSDYRGKVELSAYYRSSSSSSWTSVSNTNSTYFYTNYSDEWENGYYKMTSTDKGKVKIKNLVKFKKEGYYKIVVEDTDGNEADVVFSVGDDDDNDEISITTSDKTVDTNEYVDVTIETDSDYREKVKFSLYYKSSSSSSWKSVSNTSSTYVNTSYSDEWENGYYKMTSTDKGKVKIKNLVKFKKEGYYKIVVEDTDDNEADVVFSVGDVDKYDDDDDDDSSIDGFTKKEAEKLRGIDYIWDNLISELKSESYKLRNDSTWKNEADRIQKKITKTINGKSGGYDSFFDLKTDIVKWIKYTQENQ